MSRITTSMIRQTCGGAIVVVGALVTSAPSATGASAFLTVSQAVSSWVAVTCQDAPQQPPALTVREKSPAKNEPAQSTREEKPSEAELIAALERTIETEQTRLKELETELNDPEGEFPKAETEFQAIDTEINEKKVELQKFRQSGESPQARRLEKEIASLDKQWKLAKDRFDVAIEERKTLREEIATLGQKIQKDREALDDLTGASDPHATKESSSDHPDKNTATDKTHPKEPLKPSGGAGAHLGSAAATEPDTSTSNQNGSDSKVIDDPDSPQDEELLKAESEAKKKEEEAQEAKEDAQEITARIEDLQRIIANEQKSLALTRKKGELALATQHALEEDLERKTSEGAPEQELKKVRQKIASARSRYADARSDVAEATDRLGRAQSELASLQSQQLVALQDAELKRHAAEAAQEKVQDLRNPFAPRNILQWLIDHGPRLLMILLGMFGINQLAKLFSHRTIKLMTSGGGRGSPEERENRAKTLVGVFHNALSVSIVIGGILMVLEEVGVNITVLMGGVAVAGLAVAFGAQNLIKDYFYGFVMLLENQYMINDAVKIGEFTGQVERITLRMTVLRDSEGVVHFIPNGQINSVSNKTHGWSRAMLDIGVAYKEDIDRVMGVLLDLAKQLRQDPAFGPAILDDPNMLGVDALGDSAVIIKFFIKTRPHQQGPVRRELLRRIKNRFDELGIEIPYPHRTVFYRSEEGNQAVAPIDGIKKCA